MGLSIQNNRLLPLIWTGERGIRFHNCITALFLRFLHSCGLASGIHEHTFNGQKYYLNKGSVFKWLNYHSTRQFYTYTVAEQSHIKSDVGGGIQEQFQNMTTAEKIDCIRSRFHCFTCNKKESYLDACAKAIEDEYARINSKYQTFLGIDVYETLEKYDRAKNQNENWNILHENDTTAEVTVLLPHELWQVGREKLISMMSTEQNNR